MFHPVNIPVGYIVLLWWCVHILNVYRRIFHAESVTFQSVSQQHLEVISRLAASCMFLSTCFLFTFSFSCLASSCCSLLVSFSTISAHFLQLFSTFLNKNAANHSSSQPVTQPVVQAVSPVSNTAAFQTRPTVSVVLLLLGSPRDVGRSQMHKYKTNNSVFIAEVFWRGPAGVEAREIVSFRRRFSVSPQQRRGVQSSNDQPAG